MLNGINLSRASTLPLVTWPTLANVELTGNSSSDLPNRWHNVLSTVRTRPDQYSLVEMMTKQLRKSSVLAKDVEYFDALPVNHEDNTYQWVIVQIQKHIAKYKDML